ncbi:hypothetical protein PoB_006311900 [Plakobranchus ocellatus]|uniref:Uncharacterized protein n=1 Tax=Plakobranchus ocellatus TaxID=259542 RepID=A0AAV4CXH7_9GAST|nr:hypothetical protein PoB_006311900 [Plakobranchus ocellatus]
MVRVEKVWCRVSCMEKVGGKERKKLKALGGGCLLRACQLTISLIPMALTRDLLFSRTCLEGILVSTEPRPAKSGQHPRHNQNPPSRPSQPSLIRDAATGEHA